MAVEPAAPAARRVRRPGLRDPRLGFGVLLVATSVLVGAWAVGSADDTIAFYVATSVLTPGETLRESDVTVVRARVPDGADRYLLADEPLPSTAVVTRMVGSGELVPRAALGHAADVRVRPVTAAISGPLSQGVVEGALVDLWLSGAGGRLGGAPAEAPAPRLVATGLRVAGVQADESLFAGVGSTSVEVLVPTDQLGAVLSALAEDGDVVLVPLPGGR